MNWKNIKACLLTLFRTAYGGMVVGLALLLYSKSPFWGASEANHALTTFFQHVAEPEPAILLGVLIVMMGYFVVSGAPFFDGFASFALTPAMEFCFDLCSVAVGANIVLFLPLLIKNTSYNLAMSGLKIEVYLILAALVFFTSIEISKVLADPEPQAKDVVKRAQRVILAFAALLALGIVYYMVRGGR